MKIEYLRRKEKVLFLTFAAIILATMGSANAANLSLGKTYAYFLMNPGFGSGLDFYRDNGHPAGDLNNPGFFGTYSANDLTDGVLGDGTTDAASPTSPVVGIRGDGSGNVPVDIIIDLTDSFSIDNVVIGSSLRCDPSPPEGADCNGIFGNFAPDDVNISFSTTGDSPVDFGSATNFPLWASPISILGHIEMTLPTGGVAARYVKLSFDGAANVEKYMFDEITVNGGPLPLPPQPPKNVPVMGGLGLVLMSAVLGLMGVFGFRRKE